MPAIKRGEFPREIGVLLPQRQSKLPSHQKNTSVHSTAPGHGGRGKVHISSWGHRWGHQDTQKGGHLRWSLDPGAAPFEAQVLPLPRVPLPWCPVNLRSPNTQVQQKCHLPAPHSAQSALPLLSSGLSASSWKPFSPPPRPSPPRSQLLCWGTPGLELSAPFLQWWSPGLSPLWVLNSLRSGLVSFILTLDIAPGTGGVQHGPHPPPPNEQGNTKSWVGARGFLPLGSS